MYGPLADAAGGEAMVVLSCGLSAFSYLEAARVAFENTLQHPLVLYEAIMLSQPMCGDCASCTRNLRCLEHWLHVLPNISPRRCRDLELPAGQCYTPAAVAAAAAAQNQTEEPGPTTLSEQLQRQQPTMADQLLLVQQVSAKVLCVLKQAEAHSRNQWDKVGRASTQHSHRPVLQQQLQQDQSPMGEVPDEQQQQLQQQQETTTNLLQQDATLAAARGVEAAACAVATEWDKVVKWAMHRGEQSGCCAGTWMCSVGVSRGHGWTLVSVECGCSSAQLAAAYSKYWVCKKCIAVTWGLWGPCNSVLADMRGPQDAWLVAC